MATQMTGECNFGLHQHCPGNSTYGEPRDKQPWETLTVSLPCECECHGVSYHVKDTTRWRREQLAREQAAAALARETGEQLWAALARWWRWFWSSEPLDRRGDDPAAW